MTLIPGLIMRRLLCALLAAAAVIGLASIVSAADMPVKAPMMAPAYNWTGWYLGANVGYGSSNGDVPFTFDPVYFGGAVAGGNATTRLSPRAKGALGGIQIGYNYQMGSTVVGVEADYEFASMRGTDTFLGGGGAFMNTSERKITSLGTLRARAGWLPSNPLLLYVTGGLAYGNTSLNITETNTATCALSPGCLSATDSGTKAGWTLGGGGEWMFAPKWSLKAEYLYVDLGSRSATVTFPFGPAGNFYTGTTKFQENIVRGGINYHF